MCSCVVAGLNSLALDCFSRSTPPPPPLLCRCVVVGTSFLRISTELGIFGMRSEQVKRRPARRPNPFFKGIDFEEEFGPDGLREPFTVLGPTPPDIERPYIPKRARGAKPKRQGVICRRSPVSDKGAPDQGSCGVTRTPRMVLSDEDPLATFNRWAGMSGEEREAEAVQHRLKVTACLPACFSIAPAP